MTVYSYMKKENIPSSATAAAIGMWYIEEYTDSEGEETVVYAISRKEPRECPAVEKTVGI